jgi:aerobic-type carbon monoxide dehydrogenase small subunit (CoxS/CutS family)
MSAVHDATVTIEVNGRRYQRRVSVRRLHTHFLRHDLGLTGTHVGCEHGVCGACNVRVDGELVRACLMFAVQADGCRVETIESLATGELHPVQEALLEHHGLQCGFCTPGVVMTLAGMVDRAPLDDEQIREELSGNLCRCTGYAGILAAARSLAGTPTTDQGEDAHR